MMSRQEEYESAYELARNQNMEEVNSFLKPDSLPCEKVKPAQKPKMEIDSIPIPMPNSPELQPEPEVMTPQSGSRRSSRPRRKDDYVEEILPNRDDFSFCDICEEDFSECCDKHLMVEDVPGILVKPSTIKNAGQGVFNNSEKAMEIGTMFGPYKGKIVSKAEYDKGKYSGYAWELMDADKKRTIGYVDPGSDPIPSKEWLAIVNSASYIKDRNIVAFQFKGQIMYQVCKTIPPGAELLTYYGDCYARSLGIDLEKYNEFSGDSRLDRNPDQSLECDSCGKNFSRKINLRRHIKTVHERRKDYKCDICLMTFGRNEDVQRHIKVVHEEKLDFSCGICLRKFGRNDHMQKHIKTVHKQKQKLDFSCGICLKKFGQNDTLQMHIKIVHEQKLDFSCDICLKKFGRNDTLQMHIKTVHEQRQD